MPYTYIERAYGKRFEAGQRVRFTEYRGDRGLGIVRGTRGDPQYVLVLSPRRKETGMATNMQGSSITADTGMGDIEKRSALPLTTVRAGYDHDGVSGSESGSWQRGKVSRSATVCTRRRSARVGSDGRSDNEALMSADLTGLIERVEKATGPDRYLDGAIWKALHPQLADTNARDTAGWLVGGDHAQATRAPEITASLDAALALVEEKLPGVYWHVARGKTRPDEPLFGAELVTTKGNQIAAVEHDHSAALALILALLRALQSQSDREGRDAG
jgi:hypothetical protein